MTPFLPWLKPPPTEQNLVQVFPSLAFAFLAREPKKEHNFNFSGRTLIFGADFSAEAFAENKQIHSVACWKRLANPASKNCRASQRMDSSDRMKKKADAFARVTGPARPGVAQLLRETMYTGVSSICATATGRTFCSRCCTGACVFAGHNILFGLQPILLEATCFIGACA